MNNNNDQAGRDATRGFQHRFNTEYCASLQETGTMDPETWGAVFDMYMRELSELMVEVGNPGLAWWRRHLNFLDPARPLVACKESIPIDSPGMDGLRSQTNRRVEFIYFDPGEEPILDCPLSATTPHKRESCPIYSDFTARDYILPASVVLPKARSLRFYADTDQTGAVGETDDEWDNRQKRPGCVLVYKCDRDAAVAPKLDFQDRAIGNDEELLDFAKLVIKANPDLAPDMQAFIGISDMDAKRFRWYNDHAVDATPVLGDTGRAKITQIPLPDIRSRDYVFALELLEQLKEIKTDTIRVNVMVRRGNDDVFHEELLCSLAPWLLMSNIEEAETVYVAKLNSGENQDFISKLQAIVGAKLHIFTHPTQEIDRWVQDMFEMGFADSPQTHSHPMHQFVNSVTARREHIRTRLYELIKDDLIGPDCGHIEFNAQVNHIGSLDSFGNLDCTPPLIDFPFGRVYYGVRDEAYAEGHAGREMDAAVIAMLKANKFQPAVGIPTNWLAVGHVDEFLCFVPDFNAAAGGKNFKLLRASPRAAIDICSTVPASEQDTTVICQGKGPYFELTVRQLLTNYNGILDLNIDVETTITTIIETVIKQEFGLADEDIIALPVLFNGRRVAPGWVESAVARTGGMVNSLVVKPDIIIPEPFGPSDSSGVDLFKKDAESKLTALGLSIHFVDDWDPYHVNMGEIHCGTNVKRTPPSAWRWWDRTLKVGGKTIHE